MDSKEEKFVCSCGAPSIPGEIRCENGHDGSKCPEMWCETDKIYGLCPVHDGEKLGLRECFRCISYLIDGECKCDHSEQAEEIQEKLSVRLATWKTKFLALAKSKIST